VQKATKPINIIKHRLTGGVLLYFFL